MHRFFLFLILLSSTIYAGNQKVNQFLHLGKIEIPTLKSEIDFSSVLEFQHFDKLNWYPAENQKFILNHFKGGDVYVLTIQATTHRDSGLYICEIDSTPISKSFHNISSKHFF